MWLCVFKLYAFNSQKSAYFEREFLSEIWKVDFHSHNAMIDDLLENYDLHGLPRSEITELLGEPPGGLNRGNAYLYFIRGGYINPVLLHVYFDENGNVLYYNVSESDEFASEFLPIMTRLE
jgi:hypothetical protein